MVYDGRDITSQIEPTTNSFVINGLTKPTLLKVTCSAAGLEDVTVSTTPKGEVEYYDLRGVRVQGTLVPGIYIRRHGTEVSKVHIL